MKINKAYPLEKLMPAIDYYLEKTNRRITFEYILLHDVNDHPEEARQLVKLLKDKKHLSYVNLIPYNPVEEHNQYERSRKENILKFYEILLENGINAVYELNREQTLMQHVDNYEASKSKRKSTEEKRNGIMIEGKQLSNQLFFYIIRRFDEHC